MVIFIETSIFTKEIQRLLPDESYRILQSILMLRPNARSTIPGSGGLRKIRWSLPGSGKRGGLRIIYFWSPPDTIFMLFPYRKTEQEDITSDQLKLLHKIVKEFLL